MPKVSIIVPVYNTIEYLPRCLDSLLSQTEADIEIIVVDDGSPDGAGAVCDDYAARDRRVRVIHKENGGLSAARNSGIDVARGEFLAFVDSDDWVEPQLYTRLLEVREQLGCDTVFCSYRRVYADGSSEEVLYPSARVYRGIDELREYVKTLYNGKVFGYVWRSIYPRCCFDGLRFDPSVHYAEDLEFNLRALQRVDSLAVIPDVLCNYNCANAGSITYTSRNNPHFRYTDLLQRELKHNEYWQVKLEPNGFFRFYVDMMFQYMVRLLEAGGNDAHVEELLGNSFFASACHYDRLIPWRRKIVCRLIRARRFRLAVWVRKLEDTVLCLMGRGEKVRLMKGE